jgi:hypothetical protein
MTVEFLLLKMNCLVLAFRKKLLIFILAGNNQMLENIALKITNLKYFKGKAVVFSFSWSEI